MVDSEVEEFFTSLDTDNNNLLSMDEFVAGFQQYRQRARPPEQRAMLLSELVALRDKHRTWIETASYNDYTKKTQMPTMYEVAPTLIESATRPRQCSFSELGPPHTVDYFVSHWWGEEFAKFIRALEHFAKTIDESDPAFWICSFANNQWSLELGDDLSGSPFELALAKAKAIVMVLDDGAVALTRIWCLYEVLRAHVLEREFHIATHNGVLTAITDESAAENATSELQEDVMTLLQVLLTLDAETAGCSVEADKVKILRAVHLAVGIPQLSIVLQALLAKTAQKVMYAVGAYSMYVRVRALTAQADSIAWSDRSALHCA